MSDATSDQVNAPVRGAREPGLHRNQGFRLFLTAGLVSQVGTRVSAVAVPLVAVLALRASPLQVGLLAAAQTVGFLLVGLPAGVWVDRVRRRPLLVATDLVRGALLLAVPVAYLLDRLTLPLLYVTALGVSVATALFDIAHQSYLPTLLDDDRLARGNGRLETVRSVSEVGGPSVGGWLVALVGAPLALVVDAVSYLLSGLLLGRIKTPEPRPGRVSGRRVGRDIRQGLSFVLRHPIMRMIVLRSALANMAFSLMFAVEALFLVREVGLSPRTFGVLLATGAVGGIVGGLLAPRLAARVGTARLLWLAPVVLEPFGLLLPLTRPGYGLAFFAIGNTMISLGAVIGNVAQVTYRQVATPPELLGRMNASVRWLVWGVMPVGALLGGLLAQGLGARTAILIGVLGRMASALPLLLCAPVRRMRDLPSRDEPSRDAPPA
jgi:MFS family permease